MKKSKLEPTDFSGVALNPQDHHTPYVVQFSFTNLEGTHLTHTQCFADLWDAAEYSDRITRRLKLATPINFLTALERRAIEKALQPPKPSKTKKTVAEVVEAE